MEETHLQHTSTHPNINSLTPNNIFMILSFLDPLTIDNIIQADNQNSRHKLKLASVARNHLFLKKYVNKTDRTIYMPFYSETLFMGMQEQQLSHLCSRSAAVLSYLQESFKLLLSRLQTETSKFQMSGELIQSVIESLTDPELPFPKLRKASVGMHCNSTFQFFLVDKLGPSNQEEELEYTFEELSKYLSQKWNFSEQSPQKELDIMSQVFQSWFKISYQNFQNYLIPHNINHNMVVLVIALLDIIIDSISFYIQAIQDPLYAFIEFNLRYSIFRNIILSLENKLGFVFKNYSSFVSSLLERKQQKMKDQGSTEVQTRQMTIWHCGLSKWYIYMQKHHEINLKSFFYLFKKLNLENLMQDVEDKIGQNITFLQLRNRLNSHQAYLMERQLYSDFFSPIQQLFQQKRQLYNQVIKEYMEYVVDISINQFSVHWCGHSKQALHIPFQQFEDSFLLNFEDFFSKMVQIVKEVNDPVKALNSTAKSIITQLDKQYLKPTTLKKVTLLVQTQIINHIGEEEFLKSQFWCYLNDLNKEIGQRDKVLNHFNQIANIKNELDHTYSIVLQSEDFNKALKNSASTAVSRTSRYQNKPLLMSFNSNESLIQDF